MESRPVLITGAAGFIGSHLVERVLADGGGVVGIDNFCDFYDPVRKRANLDAVKDHPRFSLYETDFRDGPAIEAIFERHRPRAVAHLGGYPSVRYSIGRAKLYAEVNIVGSVNLLEAARQGDVEVFVFASTSSIYGHTQQIPFVETDPCNHALAPYPASKKAVEVMGYTYHNLHQLNFTAVRFFSVYGPRSRPDMMPYMVTDRIMTGQTITLFNAGQMKRDWTYVQDVVGGLVAALGRPVGYEIVNLGRGEPVLMSDFVTIIEELTGAKANLENAPAPASEPETNFANIEKFRTLFGYNPQTPISDGLARLWQWYQRDVMG